MENESDGGRSAERTTRQPERPACERCGDESRVRVLEGYVRAVPQYRQYCIRCAETATAAAPSRQLSTDIQDEDRRPMSFGTILMAVGLTLGVVAALVEYFAVPFASGFGWSQRIVVVSGAILALLGALVRVDLLVIGGATAVALAAALDLIADVTETSAGVQVIALSGVGLAMIGLFARRRALRMRAGEHGAGR